MRSRIRLAVIYRKGRLNELQDDMNSQESRRADAAAIVRWDDEGGAAASVESNTGARLPNNAPTTPTAESTAHPSFKGGRGADGYAATRVYSSAVALSRSPRP